MSKLSVKEIDSKVVWEKYLLSKKPGTFLQSWNWGETNKAAGSKIMRFGYFQKGKMIGCVQIIDQPAKRGHHLLIPGGPVIDYENHKVVAFVTKHLKTIALKSKSWFVRIRPDIKESPDLLSTLSEEGFKPAPMHVHGEHTLILDIDKNEEEILKNMRKTTRYLIKKSQSEGFKIRRTTDVEDVDILYELQDETVKRHKFVGFKKKLFEAELSTFGLDNQAEIFICEKDKRPLVAAIVIYYGEKAFYHHSGSSESARHMNASYFTQWEIIKASKEKRMRYYDFWGIAPTDGPKHRFAGVTVFKKGFGGEKVDWAHAHDLPTSGKYWLTFAFETGRRLSRNL